MSENGRFDLAKLNAKIKETNDFLKDGCTREGFEYICNDNIGKNMLWDDGVHLLEEGRAVLVDNIVVCINKVFSGHTNEND